MPQEPNERYTWLVAFTMARKTRFRQIDSVLEPPEDNTL